jgi:hypothetical protein
MIVAEMIHDARIIPLDGREHIGGEFVVMPRLASDIGHDNVSASDRI